ncbi:MAG: response regulator [Ktedonobacteraceae bacterium]|nr:response regulator [Ktedonobacteraceae bacterium]MBV9613937.1 response regulator [Ktedonobacteraceae bacterium]
MDQPQQSGGEHQPVVLVVDDNPAIRDMVSWALELDGYEPAEASEGQEALDWIDNALREGRYPSVILLDLAMPGMNGTSFLQHLYQQWEMGHPLPAIVVITAGTDGPDAEALGVQQVIIKPFHVRDLLDVVRQLTQ